MKLSNSVFIGLGTNLGNRERNLKKALEHIKAFIKIEYTSSIYETEPVDYEDQAWFLNMVIKGTTKLSAIHLLEKLQSIEDSMGRVRTIKSGPRIIDLDILFYSDKIINCGDLIVPHPEIQNRSFVLTPLQEIAPEFMHPKLKKKMTHLLNRLKQNKQVRKWTNPK